MRPLIAAFAFVVALPVLSAAQTPPPTPRPYDAGTTWTFQRGGRGAGYAVSGWGGSSYERGKSELQRRNYEQAIVQFDRTITAGAGNVDGALYWKAFAQLKLGRTDDALATLAALRTDHATSRYLSDAKVLEAEVRRIGGQRLTPEAIANMDDEEIKLLAIQGIQQIDPEGAIPLLEGVLSGVNSLAVKRRALYVLALSSQPRAREMLLSYAKGSGNPDLQIEAIRYIAANRENQTTSADLRGIYESTTDKSVKIAVIEAFRSSGGRATFFTWSGRGGSLPVTVLATGGRGRGGRGGRASSAAAAGQPQDLWALYQKEPDTDLRMQMVAAFASMNAVKELTEIVKTEQDPAVRQRAIRGLGGQAGSETGPLLVDLYGAETNEDVRRAVIGALAAQDNAEALVAIARKESSIRLKTEIVGKLSEMAARSKVAADYLMEIIK